MKTFLAACALLLLFAADACAGRIVQGVVRAVYDGDTVLLTTPGESRLKVRLYGIDAPETPKPGMPGQPFSIIAKRTLMFKVMGRTVSAEIVDSDQYHRAVAVLRYNGRDINREMVAEGMAWAYRRYLSGSYASEYIGAEEHARARHRGLWRDRNPLPPWEYRHALEGGTRHRRHR
ncbi:MAG TPA: thermonuclease family protein [Desulfuromonadaceae bacterium]